MTNDLPEVEAGLIMATTPAPDGKPVPNINQSEYCLSCGAKTPQKYCGECGLKNDDLRRSLFKLIAETLGGIFSFESRMWRTWGALIFKPGKVAREYADGARTRYSAPIRVYLVVTFILLSFLALSKTNLIAVAVTAKTPVELQAQYDALQIDPDDKEISDVQKQTIQAIIDDVKAGDTNLTAQQLKLLDKAGGVTKNNYKFLFFQSQKTFESITDKSLADKIMEDVEIDGNTNLDGQEFDLRKAATTFFQNPNKFNQTINTWVPRVMFFMVPMVMFIGVIFIRGPNALLFDHLIHAIYVQSIFFMALLFAILLSRIIPGSLVMKGMVLAFLIYLPVSLKRMFGRGWFKTIWTTLWVGGIYSFVLFISLVAISIYSFSSLAT